jgi:hypothetical protein
VKSTRDLTSDTELFANSINVNAAGIVVDEPLLITEHRKDFCSQCKININP